MIGETRTIEWRIAYGTANNFDRVLEPGLVIKTLDRAVEESPVGIGLRANAVALLREGALARDARGGDIER